MFNRAAFFDNIRTSVLFGGMLLQNQVINMDHILDTCHRAGVLTKHPDFAGYLLATAYGEVGPNMAPVREGFKQTTQEAIDHVRDLYLSGVIRRDYGALWSNGQAYFGRGYVQLTHIVNYQTMGERLDLPLVDTPDLALQPDIAADILVVGSLEGLFTGVKLADVLPGDMMGARQVINGNDRSGEFAMVGAIFGRAVLAGQVVPMPEPPYLSWWGRVWRFIKNLFIGETL